MTTTNQNEIVFFPIWTKMGCWFPKSRGAHHFVRVFSYCLFKRTITMTSSVVVVMQVVKKLIVFQNLHFFYFLLKKQLWKVSQQCLLFFFPGDLNRGLSLRKKFMRIFSSTCWHLDWLKNFFLSKYEYRWKNPFERHDWAFSLFLHDSLNTISIFSIAFFAPPFFCNNKSYVRSNNFTEAKKTGFFVESFSLLQKEFHDNY